MGTFLGGAHDTEPSECSGALVKAHKNKASEEVCMTEEQLDKLLRIRRRKLQLQAKRIDAIKQYGLPFYHPHHKQELFHRAGRFKRRMVCSGNRFGKSWMGVAEDCSWLMHERPFLPKGDPARTEGIPQRPVKGIVITTDWDKVNEIFTDRTSGKIFRLLPSDAVKSALKNKAGVIDNITMKDGSVLRFDTVQSFKTNPKGAESSDWDFIHVDEPCPEPLWKAHSRGLIDRGGSAWFTLTPIDEPWITDFFFPSKDGKNLTSHEEMFGEVPFKWSICGDTADNPYLTPQDIAMYEASLDEAEKACRLRGQPLHLSGRVYPEFEYHRHVLTEVPKGWKDFATPGPKEDYTLYYAIDPHPKTPHAVLFCAVHRLGQRYYFAEIFNHCLIRELAQQVRQIRDPYFAAREICDPLAFIENPVDGSTMADEMVKGGLMVEKAVKDLEGGILKVKAGLKPSGPRQEVFFSPHLKRTLWEFIHYVWDTKSSNLNKPKDQDDHMMECLYRLEMLEPKFIERPKTGAVVGQLEIGEPDLRSEEVWDSLED